MPPETPAFLPSRHGFRFPNRFVVGARPFGSALGYGLCGGMVLLAAEHFHRGLPVPPDAAPPPPGSPLFRALWVRQLRTLGPPGFGPLRRFAADTLAPDAALALRSRRAFDALRPRLAAAVPVPLGLVIARSLTRLWENHQVLAIGLDADDALRLYDPNYPLRDDVRLVVPPAGAPLVETVGSVAVRNVRGFFEVQGAFRHG